MTSMGLSKSQKKKLRQQRAQEKHKIEESLNTAKAAPSKAESAKAISEYQAKAEQQARAAAQVEALRQQQAQDDGFQSVAAKKKRGKQID